MAYRLSWPKITQNEKNRRVVRLNLSPSTFHSCRVMVVPYPVCLPLVHGSDPENLVTGTTRGGNFYHTFLERRHPRLLEKSDWTCQSGSLIGDDALPCQPDVKFWRMHFII